MRLEDSILATLVYSNVFNYPLNFSELHPNLIGRKTSKKNLEKILNQLVKKKKIFKFSNFYLLSANDSLIGTRILRAKYAEKKIQKARLAAKILSFIPPVKLVGISGAAAVKNAPKEDDIDFFIICAKNTLFTTRFFCTLLLDIFHLRRKPADKNFKDKVCLNMFLAENDLELAPHDLYLAHEILQMKPIFERDDSHKKFLQENFWVFKFLPNWPAATYFASWSTSTQTKGVLTGKPIFNLLESFLKKIQLKYMARRRTTEIISETKLLFHPEDVHYKVLEEFQNKLEELKILLDKQLIVVI